MGIDKQSLRLLLQARQRGADFSRSAMIGRQFLWVDAALLSRILADHGISCDRAAAQQLIEAERGFAEPLFGLLGADETESVDYSTYEGASICHDMNQPIEEGLEKRFTVVYDGGSLEHVFNFPVSIKNCMEMVAVGGHYLSATPANNQLGHGFYQFSPELFCRIFTAENGFSLERLVIYEDQSTNVWYDVVDPDSLGERVTLCSCNPAWILVQAKRIADVPVLSKPPQQSDYAAMWKTHGSAVENDWRGKELHPLHRGTPYHRFVAMIPPRVKRLIRATQSFCRPFERRMFRRIRGR